MKKLTLILLLTLLPLCAQEPVTYTIEGEKDPRLTAIYKVSYVSTGTSEECTTRKASTGTKRPAIGSRIYEVNDVNYSIKIPIVLSEDEENCGYRFRRIELVMRRLYDDDLYSLHMILNSEPEARTIYYGDKSGMMSFPSPEMPAKLLTNKNFYRIAEDTRFLCRTDWYPKKRYEEHSIFYCVMQIGDGTEENAFMYPDPQVRYATNPVLGVDALKNETLHVDIIADDEGSRAITKGITKDHVRTRPKPEPSLFKSIKALFLLVSLVIN